MPTECYIGQTKLTLKKRWQEHVRKSRDEKFNIGYGKLHRIISSRDPISFKCEIVYEANSDLDLYEKEDFFIKKFNSIDKGWNKINAPKKPTKKEIKKTIKIDGKNYNITNYNDLCRQIEVPYTTFSYWYKKPHISAENAAELALLAKSKKEEKKPIKIFRQDFKSMNEIIRSKHNKFELEKTTLKNRVNKYLEEGLTKEEAIEKSLKEPKKSQPKKIDVIYKNKKLSFAKLVDAFKYFEENKINILPKSTVTSNLRKEGYTTEQAFGFDDPPWKKDVSWVYKKEKEGYTLTGVFDKNCNPIIHEEEKEIFASIKKFCSVYNFDHSTITEEYKNGKGISLQQIIDKRK